jgi:hypothetical protein
MTLNDLHTAFNEYMYVEDPNILNVVLASIVANSLRVGDPIWLTVIGPSSSGKSQIIRPFAIANSNYIHRVDDLTPNTFLSASLGLEHSLLGKIGPAGILSMDDLTVLFSKNSEQRAEILSQFRMLYDGHYSKGSGNRKEDITWQGYLGMIAGSTPSIYRYFNEVADMGERFISYRMKPMNTLKALDFISSHPHTSKHINHALADIIREFLPPLLQSLPNEDNRPALHPETHTVIQEASLHCTLLRTPVHIDDRSGLVDEFAEPEMPFRVMKQLTYLAQGMQYLQKDPSLPLPDSFHDALRWTAYSLISDKRRAYARAIAYIEPTNTPITARTVSHYSGMHEDVVKRDLSQLQALNLLSITDGDGTARQYRANNSDLFRFVRTVDPLDSTDEPATIIDV